MKAAISVLRGQTVTQPCMLEASVAALTQIVTSKYSICPNCQQLHNLVLDMPHSLLVMLRDCFVSTLRLVQETSVLQLPMIVPTVCRSVLLVLDVAGGAG